MESLYYAATVSLKRRSPRILICLFIKTVKTFQQFLQRKTQQDATLYQILLFLILNEAQRVLGNTPLIIRSLKLHKQPLVLHTFAYVSYLTTSKNSTSDNLPRMQNQRLLVQFQVPDDLRCVARNMLSFILNKE
jgi:hypothetical protein